MKIAVCVFSGTGNTLKVAAALSEKLRLLGCETLEYRVKEGAAMPDIEECDALIFGYPVHAFNAPVAALEFLRSLPIASGKHAYMLRTSGEPLKLNDASGIGPRRILKRRGYDVRGEFSYIMPYNIIFKHSDGMASRMWEDALIRMESDANAIVAGQRFKRRVGPFKRAVSFVLRIEHTAMPFIGRRFKADSGKCTGCGTCAKLCPRGNITITDKQPVFGKKCIGCMACSFSCPSDAIRISVLNGWRVNGKYDFSAEKATDDEVCNYCKKSYLRYFHESEGKK